MEQTSLSKLRDFLSSKLTPIPSQNPLAMDFEGKRDRWNGYDTTAHDELIEEFTKVEEAKRQLKAESLHNNEPQQRVVSKSDRYAILSKRAEFVTPPPP